MNEKQAKATEWCQVRDGLVHAAIWNPDGGGYLTTYTTKTVRKEEVTTCMAQSWVSLTDLEYPWDERAALARKLKIKVCKVCEEE